MARTRPLVMRIITRLAGGGPPVHATLLNRHLTQHGFDSVLVFGNCGPTERNMEYLIQPGDRVERIPALGANPSPLHDLRALVQLWRLIRRYRPDIVHTHTAKAGVLGRIAAVLAGCSCLVHTYHGHVLEGYFRPWVNELIRAVERKLGHVSSALCTVSLQQADELSDRFAIAPENKFRVVPLGLRLESYLDIPAPDFNDPRLQVVWMGRFVAIKNLKLLREIAELSQIRKLPIDFIIAGDGPERAAFADEVHAHGLANVRLLPWQDHVEPLLQACHLLILTSHREGTPLALIQGMAAGRPFVSTPAGGTVDLAVGVARMEPRSWWYDNAVLASADAFAFTDVLERLLTQRALLAGMGQASRRFAKNVFSETRLVNDVVALYTELLAAKVPLPNRVAEVNS